VESANSSWVTMFVCANCARSGKELSSARRSRPEVPDLGLPGGHVRQIVIPCAGRLQPENVLRAFETGSDIVAVTACEEGNCHYAEGSRRCALRVESIQSLLQEIGLGEGRLLLCHLPGSAAEDLKLTSGEAGTSNLPESLEAKIAEIRDRIAEALRVCPPNPLRLLAQDALAANPLEEIAVGERGGR
jgi:F420-non-reducing hydrogenase iron-sulfur subunit